MWLFLTSAGFAFSRGIADGAVPRDEMLAHIREIAAATPLPVNADFLGGFAEAPEGVAANTALCVATGIAGLSIEDSTGDSDAPLYEETLAVQRIEAARHAIDTSGAAVILTARCEAFLVRHSDPLGTSLARLAYADAGPIAYMPLGSVNLMTSPPSSKLSPRSRSTSWSPDSIRSSPFRNSATSGSGASPSAPHSRSPLGALSSPRLSSSPQTAPSKRSPAALRSRNLINSSANEIDTLRSFTEAQHLVLQLASPYESGLIRARTSFRLRGQYQLEQTFLVAVANLRNEPRSPSRVLERLAGRRLA